ncbi:hypothetical protein ANCCAN_23009 [Ancylostoma caninum]|uniref:Uncharacterized protein n=1 Tax=Ancylostoma caninum TaxID=29170 RepID=A0A368FG86_ANCCA|nr:hypothetical protein ANCCAN_23009 [Ancylostoma caninum]
MTQLIPVKINIYMYELVTSNYVLYEFLIAQMVADEVRRTIDKVRKRKKITKKKIKSHASSIESSSIQEAANDVTDQLTSTTNESHSLAAVELDDDEDGSSNIELKQRKSGVLYFSRIPPKFTPSRLQEYFEKHAPCLIGRVHCTVS